MKPLDQSPERQKRRWYQRTPHALSILFCIMLLAALLTHLLPAGAFDRVTVDGRSSVVANSYHHLPQNPVSVFDVFRAIPLGFKAAIEIIFIVFAAGIMFGMLEKGKAVENGVGTMLRKLGQKNKSLTIVAMTFLYGLLGVAVGYENNIAMVPIATVLSLALGGDLVLAAGLSVGAMTIGFGLSPINPYTVGTGHKLAQLPMFSGAGLRGILCFAALSFMAYYNVRYFKKIVANPDSSLGKGLDTKGLALSKSITAYRITARNSIALVAFFLGLCVILWGVFTQGWYINELSAIFLIVALICGLSANLSATVMSETVLSSVAKVAPGAFMVGFATSIKVLLEMGQISDTVSYELARLLSELPLYAAAVGMAVAQSIINFFIPSGSGQALATLPVMIPLSDVLGLSRQTAILAFQIGDGVSNLVNPTLGGLVAMLSICRVPLGRWFRFILPVLAVIFGLAIVALSVAVSIGY